MGEMVQGGRWCRLGWARDDGLETVWERVRQCEAGDSVGLGRLKTTGSRQHGRDGVGWERVLSGRRDGRRQEAGEGTYQSMLKTPSLRWWAQ